MTPAPSKKLAIRGAAARLTSAEENTALSRANAGRAGRRSPRAPGWITRSRFTPAAPDSWRIGGFPESEIHTVALRRTRPHGCANVLRPRAVFDGEDEPREPRRHPVPGATQLDDGRPPPPPEARPP